MRFSRKFEWTLKLTPNKTVDFKIQGKYIRLKMSKDVFLPHPDSLLLANSISIKGGDEVLDLGIGSGILAISAAKLGAMGVYGSDTNKNAIKASKGNAILNNVGHLCTYKCGAWFRPFKSKSFDVIIANPPQIPSRGVQERKYFREATGTNYDGTEPTLTILKHAKSRLKKGGRLYIVLKDWMNHEKVAREMDKNYICRLVSFTFSPVWTNDSSRLKKIDNLVKEGKATYTKIKNKKYYKIYAYECRVRC